MADKKTVAKAEEKTNFFTKMINFFKNLPQKIAKPFKNMWHELKKVTWPSKKDLITYSLVVVAFVAFMTIVIGLLDLGSVAIVTWLRAS